MPKHHLMVGTWTPPGAIFSFEFDDEALSLKLIKRTAIPRDEPISWMAFDVSNNPRHPGMSGIETGPKD
jgi:carboxy-cis,cis-muconate cyclase